MNGSRVEIGREKLTYMKLMTNPECFMIILAMNFSVAFCLFNESILAVAMYEKFQSSNSMIGFAFTLGSISYMVTSCFIGRITDYVNRRILIVVGFSMMVL
jgi:MFS family permease